MPKPTEHKTVQARFLAHAQEIGWHLVPRNGAEQLHEVDSYISLKDRSSSILNFLHEKMTVKIRITP
jgi:type I restriction enzyme R subunit